MRLMNKSWTSCGAMVWMAAALLVLLPGTVTSGIALLPTPPSLSLHFGAPYTVTGGFLRPYGLAVDDVHSRLLVADTGNHRFKWAPVDNLTGSYTFTEQGYLADRSDPNALTDPQAIAADAAGNVYVVNTLAGNVKLYTWNGGTYTISATFCNTNPHFVNGVGISYPRDIAVGTDGSVYLLDSGNNRILKASGPNATAWSVFQSDPSWANPYGLAVDGSDTLYIADTGNHRIVKIAGGVTTILGRWGTGLGEFRYPRDVAVDRHGRIFVADTYNHRIQVLAPDGHPLIEFGHAPGISTLEKVVVDSSDRVFAVDSDNNAVLAYLGASAPAPFDPFMRDYLGDPGDEPSKSAFALSSPDILVRHQPDVDLAIAASAGMESYAFQQPRYDQTNYVYVAVHNRGNHPAADTFARVYWYDQGSPGHFPADWKADGFYTAYSDNAHNTPGNTLAVPLIAPGGVMVLGPLLWRPPAPETAAARDGGFRLGVRIINPYDYPPVGNSTTMVRDSNNVADRRVLVVRGPFATGDQNTLMVRVHFPDLSAVTDAAIVQTRAVDLASWINETSWGVASVKVLSRGPVVLTKPSTYYKNPANSLLIEMTQDVLDKLLADEPALLDGFGPGHEIGRLVLVTNDLYNVGDQATTGSWPYTVNGKTRYLTVSVQGGSNAATLFEHGMSHQLNMVDLYPHENVTFPRPYVDGWDNMAKPFNGAHPLVWSKEQATWVTSKGARILYIPRPAPGATWNNGGNPIHLYYQETAAASQTVAVAFGLTNGVTSFNEETSFYYVEARKNSGFAAGADSVLPQTGALMYYANRLIPQGQGPVILRDHVPGGTLNDAAIPVGGSESPGGTGITVLVQTGTAGADYDLAVQYNPPNTDYDVYMRAGDPAWESPDIWVDNQTDGYDEDKGRPLQDRGNLAIAGEENRVYARVFNAGPATAFDIEASFKFSEPYHTVGDEGSFTQYKSIFIDSLASGASTTPYVTWTPRTGIDPHTCARVELGRLFNDTNAANNAAQHNLQVDHSVHGSPYTSMQFPFQVRNDGTTAQLIYFRADGVPDDWNWSFSPQKALVAPGATASGVLNLQPPDSAADCTSHRIYVTGWIARGDTLVRLGGVTVQVDLQRETKISAKVDIQQCSGAESERGATQDKRCLRIEVTGCTNPVLANEDIVVRYQGPDGKPIYHTVRTNANGCYEDFNSTVEGGQWQVTAEFPGTKCNGPAASEGVVTVPLPEVDHAESDVPDPDRSLGLIPVSMDVEGSIAKTEPAAPRVGECKTEALDQVMVLQVKPLQNEGEGSRLNGKIEITDLRQFMEATSGSGLHRARFTWTGDGFRIVGSVAGLTYVGTHYPPASAVGEGRRATPGHWEMELNGVVVEGYLTGSRLRASLGLDQIKPMLSLTAGARITGALEGLVEVDRSQSKQETEKRVRLAEAAAATAPYHACPDTYLPCLARIDKTGKGQMILDEIVEDQCIAGKCEVYKTRSRVEISLKGEISTEGTHPALQDGKLMLDGFVQIVPNPAGGRGEHGGTFIYRSGDGTEVEGEMLGLSDAGTHRPPIAESLEKPDEPNHLEGRLVGIVTGGPNQGATVEARYVIQMEKPAGRVRSFVMTLSGWHVRGCLGSPNQ